MTNKKYLAKVLAVLLALAIVLPVIGNTTAQGGEVRNIAKNRAVWHSSYGPSSNWNNTGHVVTSGISSFYWQSSAAGTQYVYIDLGGPSTFNNVKLYWTSTNYATSFQIQVSDDAKDWSKVVYSTTTGAGGNPQDILFDEVTARYVRLYCTAVNTGSFYRLTEFEVYGTNDVTVTPTPMPAPEADGRQLLRGGNWKLQRASEVSATGAQLSAAYDDSNWIVATVPGTVLTSYLNNGSIPDPNYADWQFQISDSFFTADFWYRNSFTIPAEKAGQTIWLNFNNINWKADVYFNGQNVGRIEGAFIRGKFDVTSLVNYGGTNYLAVYIYKNDNPGTIDPHTESRAGTNGGILGADSPTIHASIGWDWVPTIRGRNIGIFGEVFLSYSGTAQLADPWIVTNLDGVDNSTAYNAAIDLTKAHLTFKTDVTNSTGSPITNAVVKGVIEPGHIEYQQTVPNIPANGSAAVTITLPDIINPQLWWPNRYGDQFLYTNTSTVEVGGVVSDTKTFKFGIRELRFTSSGNAVFSIYVNGARIYCLGGNWGMDESMLRMDAEWYDISVRLHKEAGFTMIRNWVGHVGNEAFWDACDKYGILIYDEFWLANPSDGRNPNDNAMFLLNAIDKVKMSRRHVSVALYCGRNEGQPPGGTSNTGTGTSSTPPSNLNGALRDTVNNYDGTRKYFADSQRTTEGVAISGGGPWQLSTGNNGGPVYYFNGNSGNAFHTERGMPNVPSLESIKKMMPEENLWPVPSLMWGLHDFTTGSAQNGNNFISNMNLYGSTAVANTNINEFVRRAQMVNYECHKALFEAPQVNRSQALIMWMSQSAWPSMVWHAADYYFDTNAGYFGIKAAAQPVNALYDQYNKRIVITNNSGKQYYGLTLYVDRYNLNGTKLAEIPPYRFDFAPDQVISNPINKTPVVAPADSSTAVNFIVTRVTDSLGNEVSRNFYWVTTSTTRNFNELQTLPTVTLYTSYDIEHNGTTNLVKMRILNFMNTPALLIRVKALTASGEQILPAYFSDNYFSLMPGEVRDITIEYDDKHLGDGEPQFAVEGWNITEREIGETPDTYIEEVVQCDGVTTQNVASGTYTFTVNVYFASEAPSLIPILAIYKGNRLFGVSIADSYTVADGVYSFKTNPIDLFDDDDIGAYSVQAFLWDENYVPLRAPKKLGDPIVDWVKLPDLPPKKSYVFEDFGYASNEALTAAYTVNTSGSNNTYEIIDATGITSNGKAGQITYTISSSGYTGRIRAYSANWSVFDTYCLWFKGDGRRGDIILQVNADWEVHLNNLDGAGGIPYFDQTSLDWQYLEIPFSQFRHRNYPSNTTSFNAAQITSYAFYVNGTSTSGTITNGRLCYGELSLKAKDKPLSVLDFVPLDRQYGVANTLFTFTVYTKLADGDGTYTDPLPGQVVYGIENAPPGITVDSNGVVSVNVANVGKYIITIVATHNGIAYRTTVPVRITAT